MNKAGLKKWSVLGALLLLTLILVWQAPEPETEQGDIVEAQKPARQELVARSSRQTSVNDNNASDITLKPRQSGGETVDLFAVPRVAQPRPVARPAVTKPVAVKPEKRFEIPFSYVGKFQSEQKTTLFLMEGSRLYLVHEGETINDEFRLQRIDSNQNELVWLYLPLNETRKMSMGQ